METFLLDTNIFGIDVDRNLKHANNETLLSLYQPNLQYPSSDYYEVENLKARPYLQAYKDYIIKVF